MEKYSTSPEQIHGDKPLIATRHDSRISKEATRCLRTKEPYNSLQVFTGKHVEKSP